MAKCDQTGAALGLCVRCRVTCYCSAVQAVSARPSPRSAEIPVRCNPQNTFAPGERTRPGAEPERDRPAFRIWHKIVRSIDRSMRLVTVRALPFFVFKKLSFIITNAIDYSAAAIRWAGDCSFSDSLTSFFGLFCKLCLSSWTASPVYNLFMPLGSARHDCRFMECRLGQFRSTALTGSKLTEDPHKFTVLEIVNTIIITYHGKHLSTRWSRRTVWVSVFGYL